MNNTSSNQNARMALKQLRMEVAADYEMSAEDVFEMIEFAHNNGISPQKTNQMPIRKKCIKRKPSHLE